MNRLHFTGTRPYQHYLKILKSSTVHVYLTYPFVLSWSMLEAMSCGCIVVASDTDPVAEVVQDRANGLLVNFFSPQQIADRVEEALDNPALMVRLKSTARVTIIEKYNLDRLLREQVDYLMGDLPVAFETCSRQRGTG